MRLERGSPFSVFMAPSTAFNSFHRVSMALANNNRDKLMKDFPGVVGASMGHIFQ